MSGASATYQNQLVLPALHRYFKVMLDDPCCLDPGLDNVLIRRDKVWLKDLIDPLKKVSGTLYELESGSPLVSLLNRCAAP